MTTNQARAENSEPAFRPATATLGICSRTGAADMPDNPKTVISATKTTKRLEISRPDNGPGTPKNTLSKILEPLLNAKRFGGGLGLPAVEKALEQHGGRLDISSEEGNGAVSTARFPAEQTAKEAA